MSKRRRLFFVAAGIGLLILAAVLFQGSRGDDPYPAATLVIEANESVCWVVELPPVPDVGEVAPPEGCGPSSVSIPGAEDRTTRVTKTGTEGTLTAVVLVNEKEDDRESTTEPFGTVAVDPDS
jgi:hypothetical protein